MILRCVLLICIVQCYRCSTDGSAAENSGTFNLGADWSSVLSILPEGVNNLIPPLSNFYPSWGNMVPSWLENIPYSPVTNIFNQIFYGWYPWYPGYSWNPENSGSTNDSENTENTKNTENTDNAEKTKKSKTTSTPDNSYLSINSSEEYSGQELPSYSEEEISEEDIYNGSTAAKNDKDKQSTPTTTLTKTTTSTTTTTTTSTTPNPDYDKTITKKADSVEETLKQIEFICAKECKEKEKGDNEHIDELHGTLETYFLRFCEEAVGVDSSFLCHQLEEKLFANITLPESCMELKQNGEKSGRYWIKPKNQKPFMINCDMDINEGGWHVIQERKDGSVYFNRDWRDYKWGFGNLFTEYWIGLQKIYDIIDNEPAELLIEVSNSERNDGITVHYKKFAIANEQSTYAITELDKFSGNGSDALSKHIKSKFASKDYMQRGLKCAKAYESGWWYNKCFQANLNGRFIFTEHKKSKEFLGIQWYDSDITFKSYSKSRMLIRRAK